ncbi:MAG: putative Fe-S cluster assembly protein SufT [Methylacidiphilales bacterium]|nr:putative Fe-S cluster assembly protein SufT [Candidatus Methylacidiphilales bacterium]MDW8350138.1 putative Fe-S cluster assembly protein SufT [Verrucomicrobiae bacterium]
MSENLITLTRDVTAIQIPSGSSIHLPAGTSVLITQALGGTYTVIVPHQPGLFRIEAEDADALGKQARIQTSPTPVGTTTTITENDIWEVLKTCYDPEIPVNIVDLGLIYALTLEQQPEGAVVHVKMTLTAPGCGMGPVIANDAQKKIAALPGVHRAQVEVVWDPPWNPSRISAEGRKKLGIA